MTVVQGAAAGKRTQAGQPQAVPDPKRRRGALGPPARVEPEAKPEPKQEPKPPPPPKKRTAEAAQLNLKKRRGELGLDGEGALLWSRPREGIGDLRVGGIQAGCGGGGGCGSGTGDRGEAWAPMGSGPGPPAGGGAHAACCAGIEPNSGCCGDIKHTRGPGEEEAELVGADGTRDGAALKEADLDAEGAKGGGAGGTVTFESHREPVVPGPQPCPPPSTVQLKFCFPQPLNRLFTQLAFHLMEDLRAWHWAKASAGSRKSK